MIFDEQGDPVGVERMGIALEPLEDYEKNRDGGGCEDARVTFFEPLKIYIMTYTAFSTNGPRIALARSKDLMHWERLGLADFAPYKHIGFNDINNKDACIFPETFTSPAGNSAMIMLHRPLFPGTAPEEIMKDPVDRRIRDHHECISYSDLPADGIEMTALREFESNTPLALPEAPWEKIKIGAGTPPMLTALGWLLIYHGVHQVHKTAAAPHHLVYSAGLMVLDKTHPEKILYRSKAPIMSPDVLGEQDGVVADVIFPTGIDRRDDIGKPDRFDIYYGMADDCIGVARLDVPEHWPSLV